MQTPRPPAVRMVGIHKRFGAVQANRDVNLSVAAGSVHGIVGENGAGKSTLMAILYGFYRADGGTIEIDGQPAQIADSEDALLLGIGMVHQHFMLVETFSALDNILLGAEPDWRLHKARSQLRAKLEALMHDTGLQVRLDLPVEDLPVGERQRLEILKALVRGARILILDEPTAVLTPQEIDTLFATLRHLRENGVTVLLITHKLKEIIALADHVTVMRAGSVVLDCAISETGVDALAEAMVGRRVQIGRPGAAHVGANGEASAKSLAGTIGAAGAPAVAGTPRVLPASSAAAASTASAAPLLEARHLCWRDLEGVTRLDDVSLALHAGEIVGIAGVSGNGQSELLDALAGLLVPQRGEFRVGERGFAPSHWITPDLARDLGVAHVPEDRHRRGLVLDFHAWESAVLGYQNRARYRHGPLMDQAAMRADTATMMERYDVRPLNSELRCAKFSGGNQQKLVLAREALPQPKVLLVGQPTRGVDIGAIEFIHARLRALRDGGGAVLVVSSELDEILALADRVVVMYAGRIAGELPIEACTEAALGRLMSGSVGPANAIGGLA